MKHYPVSALRHHNYVYVRNLKCASTFFYNNLIELGWTQSDLESVTDKDCVFGHISDPVQRRHQGVAEYIDMCGLTARFCQDPELQSLLQYAPVLDRHSLPYQWSFGSWVDRINWIPLHGTYEDNIVRTQSWLEQQGLDIDLYARRDQWVHRGDPAKKQVVKILESLWQHHTQAPVLRTRQEIWEQYYNNCKDPSWPPVPDYHDFHLLPEPIRKELATDFSLLHVRISPDLMQVDIIQDDWPTCYITQCEMDFFAFDQELWLKALEKFGISTQGG